MATEHPAPDNDTMLTLIETNEQLSLATTKHQRAVLETRKALGVTTPDPSVGPVMTSGVTPALPAQPAPPTSMFKPVAPPSRKSFPKPTQPVASEQKVSPVSPETENPFTDPVEPSDVAATSVIDHNEPFHPGFGSNTGYKGPQESTKGAPLDTTSSLKDGRSQPLDANDSDDDPYAAPAQHTAPVFRY